MSSTSHLAHNNTLTLLQRIQALDKSSLASTYTPLVLFHPSSSSQYAVVGHVQNSFMHSTLLNCRNDQGEPIFVQERLPNQVGILKDVLRLKVDVQYEHEKSSTSDAYRPADLFQKRTETFAHATNQLITRKHSDIYAVRPFKDYIDSTNDNSEVLAHINRSMAPYLGIDSVGVHLNCFVCENKVVKGIWLAKRASTKSHHPNFWDTTVAGGQPHNLSLYDNIVKEAHEEAGVAAEWLRNDESNGAFSDHTNDPLTMTTAKNDGSCMKRSFYYNFDLEVPGDWRPIPVDGEVEEFRLFTMTELDSELRYGKSLRPAMRAVLLDFIIRRGLFKEIEGEDDCIELSNAMRRERLSLW